MQITANETTLALESIEAAHKWVSDKVEEQGKLAAHETPVLTRASLDARVQSLKYIVQPLHKRPRPIPTLAPVAANATNATNATGKAGGNGTAPAAANATAGKEEGSSGSAAGEEEGAGEEEEGAAAQGEGAGPGEAAEGGEEEEPEL